MSDWYESTFTLPARYEKLKNAIAGLTFPTPELFRALILKRFVEKLREADAPGLPLTEVCTVLFDVCEKLYIAQDFPKQFNCTINLTDSIGLVRSSLQYSEGMVENKDALLDAFADRLVNFCLSYIRHLPPEASRSWEALRADLEPTTPFTVSISELISNSPALVQDAIKSFGTLPSLTANLERVSTQQLSAADLKQGYRICLPTAYQGDDVVWDYLRNSAFTELFDYRIPYTLSAPARRAHMMMVAGSDRGKTQTLEAMICADLASDDPPGMVVIDSKSDMFKRLSRLALFNPDDGRLKDRVILIDPRDAPALNPFDIDLNGKDEEALSALIAQLGYFFEALMADALSGPMKNVVNPLAQLMLYTPGANLETLLDAFDNVTKFAPVYEKFPSSLRRYFEKDFQTIIAKATRDAVKGRVHGMMNQSPAFARMFNANRNALNMATALNEGKIILVNTEEGYLHDSSPVFARYIIALANSAALSRTNIPEEKRRQAYLYIDEAGPYFDDRTPKLFRTLRSYGLGIVAAFQDFGQADAGLRSAMFGSTSIKMSAGGSHQDATVIHSEMNVEDPAFIFNQGFKHRSHTDWATYVRNETPKAISLRAPHGYLDSQPQMTDEQYQRFRADNKANLTDTMTVPANISANPSASPQPAPTGDWER